MLKLKVFIKAQTFDEGKILPFLCKLSRLEGPSHSHSFPCCTGVLSRQIGLEGSHPQEIVGQGAAQPHAPEGVRTA